MCPSTIAVGEKNTLFISDHYKFLENDNIEEETLNATNDNLYPFLYHLGKCGADSFKTIEHSQIHSFYLDCGEDGEDEGEGEGDDLVEGDVDMIETNYCNGNNEMVEIFNQKCVVCYERESVYAFGQRGHQCVCEDCYQNRGNNDVFKCVVCRTKYYNRKRLFFSYIYGNNK